MFPTSKDYEELQRFLPGSERNLHQSYNSLTPTSLYSANISDSSTDTSPESYCENSISNSNIDNDRNQEFLLYQLFGTSSADTATLHPNKRSWDTPTYPKFEKPVSSMKTPFMLRQRPILGRNIFPTTKSENQQLDSREEISHPKYTKSTRVTDFMSEPHATKHSVYASPEQWQIAMDIPIVNTSIFPTESAMSPFSKEFIPKNSPSTNLVNFKAIESSSGILSETSISPINSILNPSSIKYKPRVSPKTNPFHFEKFDQATESSLGILSETSNSAINSIINPGSIEYMSRGSSTINPFYFEKYDQEIESPLGILSETSNSPINSIINPGSIEYMSRGSSTINPFYFEKHDQETESLLGIFSESSISPINSILNPGSIGYMPRVSPITNPINFEKLNQEAESSLGIGGNKTCSFCKKNGERPKVYGTHSVKVKVENKYIVTCPVLRSYVCSICAATGDNAHTITYCPFMSKSTNGRPPSTTVTLKTTRIKSNGKKRVVK